MLRTTRLTDYGVMLLTYLAREPRRLHTARELAEKSHLSQPTVSKLLKMLAHHHLLEAHRGVKGGFRLARPPREITVAEIITALEGPIAVTECSDTHGDCRLEHLCIVRSNWRRINRTVLQALGAISLAEMTQPLVAEALPHPHLVGHT